MLPFAAVLAIVGIGQTLVVQQGGIDLSVPGAVSLAVVIATHFPNGRRRQAAGGALVYGLGVAIASACSTGSWSDGCGLNPIVATLGTNALLFAGVLGISGGSPRRTTDLLARRRRRRHLRHPELRLRRARRGRRRGHGGR